MIRKTRNRALLAGLAVTVGVSALGGSWLTPALGRTDGYGANRAARVEALTAALGAYTEAVKTCDVDASRQAYEEAEEVFNTVQTDIQFAAQARYLQFAHIYFLDQVPSGLGLFGDEPYPCGTPTPSPDEPDNTRLAEEQAAMWAEIAAFLAASPEPGTLFNDVAVLRGVYQGIRGARTAIDGYPDATPQTPMTAPDPAGAAARWAEFVADYQVARPLIAFRNEDLATELDGLVAAVTAAFGGDPATGFPEASAALAALAPRYEVAIELVTAAARNTIPSRPAFSPDAIDSLDFLGDLVITILETRDHIARGTASGALLAQTEYEDWLAYPLAFKVSGPLTLADTAMATAVANYVAAQTPETQQALRDALNVVEQMFVGQYWGTPALIQFYDENR